MKSHTLCTALLLCLCVVLSSPSRAAATHQPFRHVVLIGIDCMSTQGLLAESTPHLDALMRDGATCLAARGVLPTISLPNWSAMLCGAGPEATGVVDNGWTPAVAEQDFPMTARTDEGVFPNVFSEIRRQLPGAETGAISRWDALKNIYGCAKISHLEPDGEVDDSATTAAAVRYLREKRPLFTFVYLADVDEMMHQYGHMSPEYRAAIRRSDAYVGQMVEAIRQAGMAEETLIMVVSDHGANLRSHGGNSWAELNTPVIWHGRGIRKGHTVQTPVRRYDVAADILFALGLGVPQVWMGRPVREAYACYPVPPKAAVRATLPPAEFAGCLPGARQGTLAVDTPAVMTLRKTVPCAGEIHYTTDGTMPTASSPRYTAPVRFREPQTVLARVIGPDGESTATEGYFRTASTRAGNGLRYRVYALDRQDTLPASLAGRVPEAEGVCYEPCLKEQSWPGIEQLKAHAMRHGSAAFVFDGALDIDLAGTYAIRSWVLGAFRIVLDGNEILAHRAAEASAEAATLHLDRGRHTLHMECLATDPAAYFDIFYETPACKKLTLIPAQRLFKN